MSAGVSRVLRILAPNDLRLIWRDSFLVFTVVILPFAGLGFHWLLPYLSNALAQWVDLSTYYGLIVGVFLVGQQPVFLGAVIGILFIEERDEGTLLALQASPLSLRTFLAYRMAAAMALSVALTLLSVSLCGLLPISFFELLVVSVLASLCVPLVALVYAVYLQNKIQAVTAIKAVQNWAALPALLYFLPSPWSWIGSIVSPLYYPARLFWSAAEGGAEWWLLVPGVLLQGAGILWLLGRLRRTVYV